MRNFGKVVWSGMLLLTLVVVGNGCGKPKDPPPGGDPNAPPMVDLGPASDSNQGAGIDPSQAGAGREARESGIKGEGQGPEEQAPNTGSR